MQCCIGLLLCCELLVFILNHDDSAICAWLCFRICAVYVAHAHEHDGCVFVIQSPFGKQSIHLFLLKRGFGPADNVDGGTGRTGFNDHVLRSDECRTDAVYKRFEILGHTNDAKCRTSAKPAFDGKIVDDGGLICGNASSVPVFVCTITVDDAGFIDQISVIQYNDLGSLPASAIFKTFRVRRAYSDIF